MKSTATTVEEYLDALPPERRAVMERMLELVRANLPAGYAESMSWGMICWGIPLSRYPNTYNKQPLAYAALAAQKNHYALYLTALYGDEDANDWFVKAFRAAGKKLDMGKSCVRFRRVEDLPLDVVAQAIARVTPERYIATYEKVKPPK